MMYTKNILSLDKVFTYNVWRNRIIIYLVDSFKFFFMFYSLVFNVLLLFLGTAMLSRFKSLKKNEIKTFPGMIGGVFEIFFSDPTTLLLASLSKTAFEFILFDNACKILNYSNKNLSILNSF